MSPKSVLSSYIHVSSVKTRGRFRFERVDLRRLCLSISLCLSLILSVSVSLSVPLSCLSGLSLSLTEQQMPSLILPSCVGIEKAAFGAEEHFVRPRFGLLKSSHRVAVRTFFLNF